MRTSAEVAEPDISSGISTWTYMEAALENSALFEIAQIVEDLAATDPVKGGRKRLYPAWMMLLYEQLLWVWKSARHVDAELHHPRAWNWLREQSVAMFPDQPELQLPSEPVRRYHFSYFHETYLARPDIQEKWAEAHMRIAARQAVEIGLLEPDGPGTWTHPDSSRMLYGDGKVLTRASRRGPMTPLG